MSDRLVPHHEDHNPQRSLARDPEIIATICKRSGRVCPAALAFAGQVLRAGEMAAAAVPGFEMTGASALTGCRAGCPVLFRLSPDGAYIFCGIGADADAERLSRFADDFLTFEAGQHLTRPTEMPLALLRARTPRRHAQHS